MILHLYLKISMNVFSQTSVLFVSKTLDDKKKAKLISFLLILTEYFRYCGYSHGMRFLIEYCNKFAFMFSLAETLEDQIIFISVLLIFNIWIKRDIK